MPTPTYTPLANVTLGSAAATVTFSSISQSYRDLVLVCQMSRSTTGESGPFIRVNGDTGSNYSFVNMEGNGTSASRAFGAARDRMYGSWSANAVRDNSLANSIWQIQDYSTTDRFKTALVRTNNGGVVTYAAANRWASTSAITSIVVALDNTGSFAAGSTFALYGIAA